MSTVILYGIANCDTIKKARTWLDRHAVAFEFHDYRKNGLTRKQLQGLADALGWEAMLNRRGTTWRKLPEALKSNIDGDAAIEAMLDNPALIKRPIVDNGGQLYLGYSEAAYEEIFS